MNFFSGQYDYSVDSKGRINFKKFLKRLSPEDRDNPHYHLLKSKINVKEKDESYSFFYVFTDSSWQKYYKENKIDALPINVRTSFMNARCGEANLDSAERISFPADFLKYIKASKDLIIQGDGEKIQVWSKDEFNAYLEATTVESTDIWDILN